MKKTISIIVIFLITIACTDKKKAIENDPNFDPFIGLYVSYPKEYENEQDRENRKDVVELKKVKNVYMRKDYPFQYTKNGNKLLDTIKSITGKETVHGYLYEDEKLYNITDGVVSEIDKNNPYERVEF